MTVRTRATSAAAITAFALIVGLAGCSAVPDQESTAGGAGCLTLRSSVTNIQALRAWCRDHDDPAGAAGWLTGIEAGLTSAAVRDAGSGGPSAARIHDAVTALDAQVQRLGGSEGEEALAKLPDVLAPIAASLETARDAVCA